MVTRREFPISLASAAILLAGCASILGTKRQVVRVETNPEGAHIVLKYGNEVVYDGAAPFEGEVRKKLKLVVTASAEGFAPREATFRKATGDWYKANLWFLPFCWVGYLIDRSNGSAYKYAPATLKIDLTSAEALPGPDDEYDE